MRDRYALHAMHIVPAGTVCEQAEIRSRDKYDPEIPQSADLVQSNGTETPPSLKRVIVGRPGKYHWCTRLKTKAVG